MKRFIVLSRRLRRLVDQRRLGARQGHRPVVRGRQVADVIEAVVDTYRAERSASELFIDTVKRIGLDPFKASANAVRRSTAPVRRDTQAA